MSQVPGPQFKIKHRSGRVLGPLDLSRVKKLIEHGEITGEEIAKTYPEEVWKDINLFPEIAALLLSQARGTINNTETLSSNQSSYQPILGGYTQVQMAPTVVLSPDEAAQATQVIAEENKNEPSRDQEDADKTQVVQSQESNNEEDEKTVFAPRENEDKTIIGKPNTTSGDLEIGTVPSIQLATQFQDYKANSESFPSSAAAGIEIDNKREKVGNPSNSFQAVTEKADSQPLPYALTVEKTVAIQRPEAIPKYEKKLFRNLTGRELLRVVLLAGLLGYFGYESFLSDEADGPQKSAAVFRPYFPKMDAKTANPKISEGYYAEGLKFYFEDTVLGYRKAAIKFAQACESDPENLKAIALLASTYINLMDTSNKDDEFFSVINRLLDIVRTKGIDLTESVIAEVEFLVETSRPEAAVERIVEYTRSHPSFHESMFYYIAYAYFAKGEDNKAAKYIALFPDNKAFSPRVFLLRAQISEKLGDRASAKAELKKALKLNPDHLKSRLMLVSYALQEGNTEAIGPEIQKIVEKGALLPPADHALAYYYFSQYFTAMKKFDSAIIAIKEAIRLDRQNHDYILEYFTLKSELGGKNETDKREVNMYVYLRDGEKELKAGRYHEALTQFLRAHDENPKSILPYVKIGDMFWNLHDVVNARMNYEKAALGSPNDIEIWSKYIRTLIESYEWELANKAMDKFRGMQVSLSAIDKAAGDMYAKQGRYLEAAMNYRNAMKRESIDPDVYLAFGKILMATKQYKEAPFYFALARRLDPLNIESVVLTAKALANSTSVDTGINYLQAELQKGKFTKAELLTALAELHLQKGEIDQAQNFIDQAHAANPDLAAPWKVQAQIYLSRQSSDKKAIDRALDAYKSYSDRNESDPSGYLERFNLYRAKLQYDKAGEELDRIFNIYPKYPNLHYYKGFMLEEMGNANVAVAEYNSELKNNPNSVITMVALGRTLLQQGKAKDALAPLQKAMEIAPQDAQAKFWAALTNHKIKNYSGAIALFRSAASLDPGNALIYKRLGECYRDTGDLDNARTAFRKYLDMEPDAQDRSEIEKYL